MAGAPMALIDVSLVECLTLQNPLAQAQETRTIRNKDSFINSLCTDLILGVSPHPCDYGFATV